MTTREVRLPISGEQLAAFEMHAKRLNKPVEWVIGKMWGMWIEGVRRPGSWESNDLDVLLGSLDTDAQFDDDTTTAEIVEHSV